MEANSNEAMREALEKIREIVTADAPADEVEIANIAYLALAKPPRNCDRFADELDAQLAFLNEVWLISIDRETMTEQDTYERWTDEMRTRYGRWLFAPADIDRKFWLAYLKETDSDPEGMDKHLRRIFRDRRCQWPI